MPAAVLDRPKLRIVDQRTHRVHRIDGNRFGEFLHYARTDTPSERRAATMMSRQELADAINERIRRHKLDEPTISPGIIARLEEGMNVLGGHFVRVQQLLRELDFDFSVQSRRDTKLRYVFAGT